MPGRDRCQSAARPPLGATWACGINRENGIGWCIISARAVCEHKNGSARVHDGRVYTASRDGWVYCCRLASGKLPWRARPARAICWHSILERAFRQSGLSPQSSESHGS